jgi:hypothetical protein
MAADYQHETRETEASPAEQRGEIPDIRRGTVMTGVIRKSSESQSNHDIIPANG